MRVRALNKVDLPTLGKPTMPIETEAIGAMLSDGDRIVAMKKTIVLLSHYEPTKEWLVEFLRKRGVIEIAYIMDAKRPRLNKDPDYVFADKEYFEQQGLGVDFIELSFADRGTLKERLTPAGAIYVKGGNSFYLLDAIRKSGFDKIASELVEGGVIYVGESAGSYVACPTIEMAHWKQQDRDIVGLDDLTGLGLVPFLVTAHYKEELEPIISSKAKETSYGVRRLADNQVIVVEDGEVQQLDVAS